MLKVSPKLRKAAQYVWWLLLCGVTTYVLYDYIQIVFGRWQT